LAQVIIDGRSFWDVPTNVTPAGNILLTMAFDQNAVESNV